MSTQVAEPPEKAQYLQEEEEEVVERQLSLSAMRRDFEAGSNVRPLARGKSLYGL